MKRSPVTKQVGESPCIDNFIEAAKALRGEPHQPQQGYVFANAYVHQTVESMCIALMVDPQGHAQIIAPQDKMRATLDRWIPKMRFMHEGYVSGYFIESAINHYTMTDGQDMRLYTPPSSRPITGSPISVSARMRDGTNTKKWSRQLGRFVNDVKGHGSGDAYIALARILLDNRKDRTSHNQSHLPPASRVWMLKAQASSTLGWLNRLDPMSVGAPFGLSVKKVVLYAPCCAAC